MRLQPYTFSIEYHPRHPNVCEGKVTSHEQKLAEHYVNFIAETSIPNAMTLEEVKTATSSDKTLMKAMEYVHTGRWFEIKTSKDSEVNVKELQQLSNAHEELTCSDNVLLYGCKIVMTTKLRDKAVALAHEGHQGMNRTRSKVWSKVRSKVWFPRLNEKVEKAVQNCLPCQTIRMLA